MSVASDRGRSTLVLAGWVGLLALAVLGLHRLGSTFSTPPPGQIRPWLEANGAAYAVVALLRLVALGLGWYLLLTTVAATALRLVRAGSAARAVERAMPEFARRLVQAAAGVSLAAATLGPFATAAAAPANPSPTPEAAMRRLDDSPSHPAKEPDTEVTMRRLPNVPDDAGSAEPPSAPTTSPVGDQWTVEAGQHLWSVAESVLTRHWGRPPTDHEVDPYWRVLVEANRSRLSDPDNPDLVFPGQSLTIPPPHPLPRG